MSRKKIEMYFDYSCPYAYLASTQVEALAARCEAELVLCPVLLGGLYRGFARPDNPMGNMSAAKAAHNVADFRRWADFHGVPLRMPDGHPQRTVEALRLTLAAPEAAWPALMHALYRAYWVDGRGVTDRAVLAAVADEALGGSDGASLVARIDEQPIKDELRRRTDGAVARGVFGVPTFFVGDDQLWGQDRLVFVERLLRGEGSPAAQLEAAGSVAQ